MQKGRGEDLSSLVDPIPPSQPSTDRQEYDGEISEPVAPCEEPSGDITLAEGTVLDVELRLLSCGDASPVELENAPPGRVGEIRSLVALYEDFQVGSTAQAGMDLDVRPLVDLDEASLAARSPPREGSKLTVEPPVTSSKSQLPDQDVMELDLELPVTWKKGSTDQHSNAPLETWEVEKIIEEELWEGETHFLVKCKSHTRLTLLPRDRLSIIYSVLSDWLERRSRMRRPRTKNKGDSATNKPAAVNQRPERRRKKTAQALTETKAPALRGLVRSARSSRSGVTKHGAAGSGPMATTARR